MGQVLNLALPFFALIGLGYLTARLRPAPREGLVWMNTFIIYLALPALFFNLLSKTPVEQLTNGAFIFATTFSTYLVFVAVFAVSWFVRNDVPTATVQGLAGAYGNIGYMGPGLAIAAFGPEAVVPVALIFCFDNTMHFALAPLLMALGGTGEQRGAGLVFSILRKVLTHPFIIATMVGILAAFVEFEPPRAVATLLGYLANAAAPCALFVMGVTVALSPPARPPFALGWVVPFKLLLQPLLVWLMLGWAGDFDPVWVYAAVLLGALPTATNVFVIAQQYDVWTEGASASIVATTLLSVVTVTGALFLMKTGALPVDPFPS